MLRVVVRPGFFEAAQAPSTGVDERLLLERLATRLGVGIAWLEASRHDQILSWLMGGRADIAVSRFSDRALLDQGCAPTEAVDWVDDLVITAQADSDLVGVMTLDAPVFLHPSARHLKQQVTQLFPTIRVRNVPEEVSFEEMIRRVASGRYGCSVADSGLLGAHKARGLRVIASLTRQRPLAWGVRESSKRLLAAVNDFLFAEQVLSQTSQKPAFRDLDQVTAARVVRLVTRNSPTTCQVERGGLGGFEYNLVSAYARSRNLRIELVIPPVRTDPLDWLERGFGDLAALHEPVSDTTADRFLLTTSYRSVDLVSILVAGQITTGNAQELAGAQGVASRQVS